MESSNFFTKSIIGIETLLMVILSIYFTADLIRFFSRLNKGKEDTANSNKNNLTKILVLTAILIIGGIVIYIRTVSHESHEGKITVDPLLYISFAFIILFAIIGYVSMSLIERYKSFRDENKKKELRILIAVLFLYIILGVFIFYLIGCLALCDLYPLQYLIFWSSLIATFLSTVFADDQNQRVKNGTFGALASGGITAVVVLIQKTDATSVELLLFSFYGSTLGGLFGWLVFALIAALIFYRYGLLFPFVELITNGFGKFRDQIILLENAPSIDKLQIWMQRFNIEIRGRLCILENTACDCKADDDCKKILLTAIYKQMVRIILMGMTEQFNLIFATVQFRATIIRFKKKDGDFKDSDREKFENGMHDFELSYYGSARRFKERPFDKETKAYKMVDGEIVVGSKTFDATDGTVASRESTDRYISFTLFRLTKNSVLSVDWGQEATKQKLEILEDRINENLVPLLMELMSKIEAEEKIEAEQKKKDVEAEEAKKAEEVENARREEGARKVEEAKRAEEEAKKTEDPKNPEGGD